MKVNTDLPLINQKGQPILMNDGQPATISVTAFTAVSAGGHWSQSADLKKKRDIARTARKLADAGIQDFSDDEIGLMSEAIAETFTLATLWAFDDQIAAARKADNL